jgi:hypothetical protein
MKHAERPRMHDPETWPVDVQLPRVGILPVKHFTSQSDINEGGLLIALDGEPQPIVFVTVAEEIINDPAARETDVPDALVLRGVTRLLSEATEAPMRYPNLRDLILDGWRPE